MRTTCPVSFPAIERELKGGRIKSPTASRRRKLRGRNICCANRGYCPYRKLGMEYRNGTVKLVDELFRIFQRDPREGAPISLSIQPSIIPDDMARLRQAVKVAVAMEPLNKLELRAIRKGRWKQRVCVARGVTEWRSVGGRSVCRLNSKTSLSSSGRRRSCGKSRGNLPPFLDDSPLGAAS